MDSKIQRYGTTLGIERIESDFVENPNVQALFDAIDVQCWKIRAGWDDFNLGLKHGREFCRATIVGNQGWLEA